MSYVVSLLFVLGAIGWPLAAFVLSRYAFHFSRPTTAKIVTGFFPLVIILATAFGGAEARVFHAGDEAELARLVLWRSIAFAVPYAIVAVWLALRLITRAGHCGREKHLTNR